MYNKTIAYLNEKGIMKADVALILGSGLGDFVEVLEDKIVIPYQEIPDFPVSTVEGHAGQLVYGLLNGKRIIALQGRFHYYEGYDLETVTYPVRIFIELDIPELIVTNAAGGVNTEFTPGDLMLITDHINLSGNNPLIGANIKEHGPRFIDATNLYTKKNQEIVRNVAQQYQLDIKEGIYTWMTGPSYETPAEIHMIRLLGGDAVGMSTVPEVLVANHGGMNVTGISCITNLAAGMQDALNHEEVVETSNEVKPKFIQLLQGLIEQL